MYKKFSETHREIIILDEWVEARWNASNVRYYENLGYKYTRINDIFLCDVSDLSPMSSVKVLVQCPVCEEKRSVKYANITIVGHTLCNGCSQVSDLTGGQFGRWTVISFDGVADKGAKWLCECECGSISSILNLALISGSSRSCGCYHRETMRKRVGDKSSHWNPDISNEERIVGRSYNEYKKYTKDILELAEYQCQICGAIDTELEVHHLYSYAYYPEYRLSQDHAVAICKEEHKSFHSWMGGKRVPCTPGDFQEWLYLHYS